nr:hypothetical protein CFP56_07844 [Quercus suber]
MKKPYKPALADELRRTAHESILKATRPSSRVHLNLNPDGDASMEKTVSTGWGIDESRLRAKQVESLLRLTVYESRQLPAVVLLFRLSYSATCFLVGSPANVLGAKAGCRPEISASATSIFPSTRKHDGIIMRAVCYVPIRIRVSTRSAYVKKRRDGARPMKRLLRRANRAPGDGAAQEFSRHVRSPSVVARYHGGPCDASSAIRANDARIPSLELSNGGRLAAVLYCWKCCLRALRASFQLPHP